jgi:large subunit ribosomal protein L25
MAEKITMKALLREETGKNNMRRLRRNGLLPGIIFGRSGETTQVSLSPKELERIVNSEHGFNTIFTIDVEGVKQSPQVMIKDYQLDPVTHDFLHVSFYRVHMDRAIEVDVAITTFGVAPGVKDQGGTLDFVMREIKVECLPGDIPDTIMIDVSQMNIGDHVRVENLAIPEKVKVLEDPESVVLLLAAPRKVEVEVTAEEAEAAAEAAEAAEAGGAEEEEGKEE